MQFIGTGDRILTENFNVGYLYTITFKTGIYINSACIGIGDTFVMFQKAEPDLLFTLNVDTAEEVDTIELYESGGGTNDYDDLVNRPQINSHTLTGNMTGSNLGLQDTISDLDTIRTGAAAGATAVQPADMTSALALKQDALNAAQLNAVNSGITSTDVAQIETNKNNISLIKHADNTSIYIQETTPTGAVGDYWISAANGVKTYGRTAQLFNIDDSNMFYNGYINNNINVVNYSAGGSKLAIIPCTAGEQYTIAVNSKTLRIAGIATAPNNDAPILSPYRYQYDNYEKHTYTYTAPEGAIYLLVNCYLSSIEMVDEKSIDDIFGTLMINEGSTAAEFAPYYDWT